VPSARTQSPATGNAALNVLVLACGSTWATGLGVLLILNYFFAGAASVSVTARITFALARDGGFPWSAWIATPHATLQSPANAIAFVFGVDVVILLLLLGGNDGETAFYAVVNLCTLGFQVSCGSAALETVAAPSFSHLPLQPQPPISIGGTGVVRHPNLPQAAAGPE
jgi:amino acid transporter